MEKKKTFDPKVTIVIPVYNGAKYLKYAIESALAQTYKNLEILVIDDGSTDDTEKIARSYGKKIRYIKKENGGVSTALNLAIKEMKGDYFSWLSHDDTYEPNKIEREIEFLRENKDLGKKVIVFSDYYLIDKNGKLIAESRKNRWEIKEKPEYIMLKGYINGLSLLIPRQAFDDCGEFDTELVCAQDYEMWRRMMKKYKFVHVPECLVSTRWHKGQKTHTNPKVESEGNKFYMDTLNEISDKRAEEMEGSKYNLLMELAKFHQSGDYRGFSEDCRKMAKEIFEKAATEVPQKKVSVIIPFYNRIEKTKRAIRSVLSQTHQNVEIILVDDGSDDDIREIEALAKKYKLKLLRSRANAGASAARNMGIKAATGDYIAFLDSDDEFVQDKLALQLQYMIAAQANFSHTSYSREEDGKITVVESGLQSGHCLAELVHHCTIATPTVMIDLKWLKEKGILFDTSLEIGEDTCFWLELLKGNEYLLGINKPLSIVHTNENSAAYDAKKQAVGLRTIIKYLIDDEYYGSGVFDEGIAKLMKSYIGYMGVSEDGEDSYTGTSLLQKVWFFAKQEGITGVIKRAKIKIGNIRKKADW